MLATASSQREAVLASPDGALPGQRRQQQNVLQQVEQRQEHAPTSSNDSTGVADQMAILRTRDTCAAHGAQATTTAEPEAGIQECSNVAKTTATGQAADWQARLMEAILHEQLQGREPNNLPAPSIDITDEGWLPT